MRRLLVFGVFFGAMTLGAFAEESYLVNNTSATLYVLEQGGAVVTSGDASLDSAGSYREVSPGGVLPYRPDLAIAGFAFSRGSFQLPTFTLTPTQAQRMRTESPEGRSYVAIGDGLLSNERVVSPADFSSVLSQPRIDNQYLDWVSRSAAIARGRTREPLGVYADFGEGRELISLSDSLLWGRGGTDLQWVKTRTTTTDLFIAASSYTTFAKGTALFMYLYADDGEVPVASMEIPASPDASKVSFVLLWLPGESTPSVMGNVAVSEFYLEAQLWEAELAAAVGVDLSSLSVEVATASSAAGLWEEFVLARDRFGVLFGE